MTTSVSVSRVIAASPEVVWAMVSDLPRMGEWSPENAGGRWVKGAHGPAVGARFKGVNRNGGRSWKTDARVTACEQGRTFAFDVRAGGLAVANWCYEIEPRADGAGSLVTETWTDQRGMIITRLGTVISRVPDRAAYTRGSMETTLARLAEAAEVRR